MANVMHRIRKEFRRSVNTPEYPQADWIINPDLTATDGFEPKYWTIDGDKVGLMTQAERDAVDAAAASAGVAAVKAAGRAQMDTDRVVRALALVILDEINLLRAQHSLAARTASQLVTAIKNKIDSEA